MPEVEEKPKKKARSKKPSFPKAVLAKCHECMGYYWDGRIDCCMPACPLYSWMPYKEREPDLSWMKYSTKMRGKKLLGHKKSKKEKE